jgi:hypothetical protein
MPPDVPDKSIFIYSEENVRRAEAAFLHMIFCVLLLCPIIGLEYLNSKVWKLVLLGSSLVAASVLCVGFLNSSNTSSLALIGGYVTASLLAYH